MMEKKDLDYLKGVTYSASELVSLLGVAKPTLANWVARGYLHPLKGYKIFRFNPHEVILLPIRLKEITPWQQCIQYARKLLKDEQTYNELCRRLFKFRSVTNCDSWIRLLLTTCHISENLTSTTKKNSVSEKSKNDCEDLDVAICKRAFESELLDLASAQNIFGVPSYQPLDVLGRIYTVYVPNRR